MPRINVSYSDYKYKYNDESIVKISYMEKDIDDKNYFVRECFLFELKTFEMIYGRFIQHETLHKANSFSPFKGCDLNLTDEEFNTLLEILKDRTKYEEAEMNNFWTAFPLFSKFLRVSKSFWDTD